MSGGTACASTRGGATLARAGGREGSLEEDRDDHDEKQVEPDRLEQKRNRRVMNKENDGDQQGEEEEDDPPHARRSIQPRSLILNGVAHPRRTLWAIRLLRRAEESNQRPNFDRPRHLAIGGGVAEKTLSMLLKSTQPNGPSEDRVRL
jgi:hypothetical protein